MIMQKAMRLANSDLFAVLGRLTRWKYFSALGAIGLAAAIGFGVARIAVANGGNAKSNEARDAMLAIRSAAYRWHFYHGESTCPSIRQLVEGKFLGRDARKVDPWEQPYVITCWESGAVVTSFGPDRRRATPDDIVVSTPNSEFGGAK